ncbi:hypothetical protein LEMLEM_LOCUS1094 [Lemmus lemmus]
MVKVFNTSTWEAEADGSLSSRTARATQRNPVSKNQNQPRPPPQKNSTKRWWCIPLIPALRRQRQADL